ncbi:cytochrome P450 [Kribbella kalugense]|uniref:Cytochrome P450 n=1 Tax=Kribbella kalugense TaxID=2512221 RepID=A0A4R7ZYV7_9ACTN|nr:cytochrome P450 [Kribbella kalugense]TDW23242.1 cytochrome P450 [Kribbella kalugense]
MNLIESLLSPAGRADPFPLYAEAHRLGPVLPITDSAFLVVGYAASNEVLRNPGFRIPTNPSSQPSLELMQRSILRANPPDHGRMRSLISQVFTPRRVAALQPAIEAAVDGLIDGLPAEVDFMDRFAFQLPVTVICELLGVPASERDRFRPLASDLTAALELTDTSDGSADAAARELGEYFAHLIRNPAADGLVSALVAARDAGDGRLSDEELLGNLILLLVAGFETTTDLLGNGLAILLDRPELTSTARSDPAAFVEEVLRYDSPVQLTTRVAHTEGLSAGGVPMPAGSDLILLLGAANRDPARFPRPDEFDPARTDNKPLSFGAGAHICLGNSLARLEGTIAFTRLVERYSSITAEGQAARRDRLVLRGYRTLPVRLTAAGCHPGATA